MSKLSRLFLHLSLQDQIMFAKRLAILVKAGIPILSGLKMLDRQTNSRSTKKILKEVIRDVENGQFLSASLGRFRKIFGDFTINIIEVGEISGTLPENLDYLAEELKKKQALRKKVLGSLIYPAIIVVATLGITVMLTVFIFPKVLPIFKSVNFELPITTKILIFLSDLFLHSGLLILAGVAGAILLFWLLLRVQKVRLWYHHFLISVPVLGKLLQSYHMANFCRTMGILLRSGVMIVRTAHITAHTITNLAYRQEILRISESITRGGKISTHMDNHTRLFPPILSQMITVGEDSGNLSETLLYLADMYEDEVDELTKNLSTVLEPVLMVFMGLLVGFVAISIITPIYGIIQHLHP